MRKMVEKIESKDGRLYRFKEGHGRMVFGKTEDNEWAYVLGVSEIDAGEPKVNWYDRDEQVYPVFGVVINSPEMAEAMAEGLVALAGKMREEHGL